MDEMRFDNERLSTQLAILAAGHGPEACRDASKHTDKSDAGYVNWHAWSARKSKTHTQHRCQTCGFWVMWKRKAQP